MGEASSCELDRAGMGLLSFDAWLASSCSRRDVGQLIRTSFTY